jgi:hypothetical protein
MKITLLFGTSTQNNSMDMGEFKSAICSTDLIVNDRLEESFFYDIIKASNEMESDRHTMIVTCDPTLSLLAVHSLCQAFPEIKSVRWSGQPDFEAIHAFRSVMEPLLNAAE